MKLQVSNVFLVKLNSYCFLKNVKDVLEKILGWSLNFFIWTKYGKDNNGFFQKKVQNIIVDMKSNEVIGWQRQWVITFKAKIQIFVKLSMWLMVYVR